MEQVATDLLNRDAPPRDWREYMQEWIDAGNPLPQLPEKKEEQPPPDSVSPEEHLRFWQENWGWGRDLEPTKVARRKLLRAVIANPGAARQMLYLLPQ
ncbi:MAG: hypothetical protein AAF585_27275, partial [Verrucomicrobiota bacterium]